MNALTQQKPRIEVVDSLRGFAIMAIMLLHSIEHFNYYSFPNKDTQPGWLNNIDQVIWDTLFFLFGGKGYAIFALLFGFTFSLMYLKQKKLSKDFGFRYLWRLLLLACFAFINGMLFPGEVLLMYSMVGVVLFFVRKWNNTLLLISAIFFLLQPLDWYRFILYLVDNNYTVDLEKSWGYWKILKKGQSGQSFINLIISNTQYGHKATLIWAYNCGRLVQTAGLFILGFLLGKMNLFTPNEKNFKFWKKILVISIILFIPFYFLERNFQSLFKLKIYKETLFKVIDMYGNLAFTFILTSSFILLYQTKVFRKLMSGLRYCGRMSLTAYIFQSVIGGFVFYGYGLDLGPHVRYTVSFIIGIILFIIQFYFCKFWILKYKQGPFEKLWHKLTWIKT